MEKWKMERQNAKDNRGKGPKMQCNVNVNKTRKPEMMYRHIDGQAQQTIRTFTVAPGVIQ